MIVEYADDPRRHGHANWDAARTHFRHAQQRAAERISRSRTITPEEKTVWRERMQAAFTEVATTVESQGIRLSAYALKNAALTMSYIVSDRKMPLDEIVANIRFVSLKLEAGYGFQNAGAQPEIIDRWRRESASVGGADEAADGPAIAR